MPRAHIVQAIAIIIFATVTTSWLFFVIELNEYHNGKYTNLCYDCEYSINPRSDEILRGDAVTPFQYRVLTPFLQQFTNLNALLAWHVVARLLLFSLAYAWVLRWQGDSIAAVLLLAMALVTMSDHWRSNDYMLTEAILLLVAWLLMTREHGAITQIAIAGLVVVGALNRETTGALIALSYAAYHWQRWRVWMVYGALAAMATIGIRLAVGIESTTYTLATVFERNLQDWRLRAAVLYNAILLPVYVVLLAMVRQMPKRYLWLLVALLPYIVALLTRSWYETRLQLPILLALLPMIQHCKIQPHGVQKRL